MAREMARAIERDGGGEMEREGEREREKKKNLLGDPGVGSFDLLQGS